MLHVSTSSRRRHKILKPIAKRHDARLVFLAHRNIRQHQGGIDGIIQISHAPEGLLHHSSFVDDIHDLLGTFILINIRHQSGGTGGGSPVDTTEIIAYHIILDLLKLRMIADAANALDAQVGEAVTDGKQLIMRQHQVRRINLDITRRTKRKAALQQAKRRLGKNTNISEGIGSTNCRTKGIPYILSLFFR